MSNLVLSRKSTEAVKRPGQDLIRIGEHIRVRIVAGHNVKVAIDAPPDLKILRGELFDEPQPPRAA